MSDANRRPDPDETANPQDPGASSDGDQSWAKEPESEDPDVDRSVDATIKRTGGR